MNNQQRYGPGPIVHGPSLTNPNRYIVEQPDTNTLTLMTHDEIAAIPLKQQWFSGTQNGLIASWWNRQTAEQHGQQLGVIVGQIKPLPANQLDGIIIVLCDTDGHPLKGT